MTTTCPDCTQAALTAWHGFRGGCTSCAARAVSRGQNYAASRTAGMQTRRYRAELEQFGVTHDDATRAAKADHLQRETTS